MGIKKIAASLKDILGSSGHSKTKQIETVKKLIGKLEKKKARISQKLQDTQDATEIKKLERKLGRCVKQLEKGQSALKQLS